MSLRVARLAITLTTATLLVAIVVTLVVALDTSHFVLGAVGRALDATTSEDRALKDAMGALLVVLFLGLPVLYAGAITAVRLAASGPRLPWWRVLGEELPMVFPFAALIISPERLAVAAKAARPDDAVFVESVTTPARLVVGVFLAAFTVFSFAAMALPRVPIPVGRVIVVVTLGAIGALPWAVRARSFLRLGQAIDERLADERRVRAARHVPTAG